MNYKCPIIFRKSSLVSSIFINNTMNQLYNYFFNDYLNQVFLVKKIDIIGLN
jgi:hypothetical protein